MDSAVLHTTKELDGLKEGERAEIIDGMWFDMAAPTRTHQLIISELTTVLNNHIKSKGGKCKVFPAPFAVYLNNNDRTYVEPDITVLCDESKSDEKGIYGAPDIVIEVTSPGYERKDYLIKLIKYRSAGVKEYWIINPNKKTINTYYFDDGSGKEYAGMYVFDDEVSFSCFPDLKIKLSDMVG